jgi:subtilisin family serine protease
MWKRFTVTISALSIALVTMVSLSVPALAAAPEAAGQTDARLSRPLRTPTVGADEAVPGEYIVKYRSGLSVSAASSVPALAGVQRVKRLDLINADVVRLPEAASDSAMAALLSNNMVEYVVPNSLLAADALPNDPEMSKLWGLNNTGGWGYTADTDIDAPEAWETTQGSANLIVAVVDSGTDINHPDLANRIYTNTKEVPNNGVDDDLNGFIDDVHGWDFYFNDRTVYDGYTDEHGTHVSGTIAAAANNAEGVAGVAPNVRILPLKFLGPTGKGPTSAAVQAIAYAKKMGAKVINASWGGAGYSQPLADAIAACDCVFVAAAGNSGLDTTYSPHYPSSLGLPNMISVASVNGNGALSSFSNYSSTNVHVAAPGRDIYSSVPSYSRGAGAEISATSASGRSFKAVTHAFSLSVVTDAQDRTAILQNTMTTLGLPSTARILLVDDDASSAGKADVRAAYTQSFQSAGFANVTAVDVDASASGPTLAQLQQYDAVVWISGDDTPYSRTILTSTDNSTLHSYLDQGGRLWLSGTYVAWAYDDTDPLLVGDLGVWSDVAGANSGVMVGRTGTAFSGGIYEYNNFTSAQELTLLRNDAKVHLTYRGSSNGTYGYMSGTSMATPHVSGIAALVLSKVPSLSPIEVVQIIKASAVPLPSLAGKVSTGGMANANLALQMARPPYAAVWGQHGTPTVLEKGRTVTVPVTVSNTGSKTWVNSGDNAIYISYQWKDSQNRAVGTSLYTLLPQLVAPDGNVTVNAQLKAPDADGAYTLSWDLVEKGVTWFAAKGVAPLTVAVTVKSPYGVNWGAHTTPAMLVPDQTATVSITLTNTGSKTWPIAGTNPVLLSYRWKNSQGAIIGTSLYTPLPQAVSPGQSVTVSAQVKAPPAAGAHSLEWDLVEKNVTWFSAKAVPPLKVPVTVGAPYSVGWGTQSTPANMTPGQVAAVTVGLTNTGTKSWVNTGTNPVMMAYRWKNTGGTVVGPVRYFTLPNTVSPGQSVTVSASLEAPTSAGTYTLEWELLEKNVTWFSWKGVPSLTKTVTVGNPYGVRWDGHNTTRPMPVPGFLSQVNVLVTNTGTKSWPITGDTPVFLAYRWKNSAGQVVGSPVYQLLPHAVAPGNGASVYIMVKAPSSAGDYTLEFDLVEKNVTWFSAKNVPSLKVPVTVQQAYGIQWGSNNTPAVLPMPNQTTTVSLTLTNSGSKTWPITGANPVYVSYRWRDLTGQVTGTSLYTLLPQAVAPGQSVTVNASLKAPASLGSYTLEWDLVEKDVTWFSQKGVAPLTKAVTVGAAYAVGWNSHNTPAAITPGQTVNVTLSLINQGTKAWPVTGANPIYVSYRWMDSANNAVGTSLFTLLPQAVAPGGSVTVIAQLQAPPATGTYTLEWDLVEKDVTWFSWQGADTLRTTVLVGVPYGVSWDAHNTPTVFQEVHDAQLVNITFTNTGTKTWSVTGANPVQLAYRWKNSSNQVVGQPVFIPLPQAVSSGGSVTVTTWVNTPGTPGTLTLEWDLVEKDVTWFSSRGVSPLSTTVTVGKPYGVAWISDDTPSTLTANQVVTVNLRLMNYGTKTWPVTGTNPIYVSYRWRDISGNVVGAGTELYTILPLAVAPGGSVDVTVQLKAPIYSGGYTLEWDLVEKNVTWFSWQGALVLEKTLMVE